MLGYAHRPSIGAAPGLYPNGWPYRITAIAPAQAFGLVASVSPLILFVPRTADVLRHTSSGGLVQSAAGWDLRYETPGQGKLAHDLLRYDGATGATGAFVRFPAAGPADLVTLHLYFGRSGLAGTQADPAACWAGCHGVIDLATGTDRAGKGADLALSGVSPAVLAGMPAGDYTPAAAPAVTPSLGTISRIQIDDASGTASNSFTGHTSTTGNLAVFLARRATN